jgi:autotransporter-associated beta strand protein
MKFIGRKYRFRTVKALKVCVAAVAAIAALRGAGKAAAQTLTWDSGGASPTNPADGGGTWDTTSSKWSNGSSDSTWVSGDIAVFGHAHGAAGTVTLSTGITANGLTFNAPGSGAYTIAGTAQITANTTFSITANGTQATVSAPIGGSGLLNIAGSNGGSVTLLGTNTYTSATQISSGSLILDSASAINTQPLTIDAGATLDINASMNLGTSSIYTNGNVTIASGATLGFNNSSSSITYGFISGTLAVNGSLVLPAYSTFNYTSGSITGNPITVNSASIVNFGSTANTGEFDFVGSSGSSTVSTTSPNYTLPAGITLKLEPSGGTSNLSAEVAVNNGTILINAPAGGSATYNQGSNTLTNNAQFTVQATGTPSAAPIVSVGQFTNSTTGYFNVDTSTTLHGNISNSGTLTVAAGATLSVTTGYFNQVAGTLALNGGLAVTEEFAYNGGTITAPITLGSDSILILGSTSNPATFVLSGSGINLIVESSNLAISPGITLDLDSSLYDSVTANSNLSNNGVVAFPGYGATFGVTNLTNNATLNVSPTIFPSLVPSISATQLVNSATGNFNVSGGFEIDASLFVNSGTITVASGQTLNFEGVSKAVFNQTSGAITVSAGGNLTLATGDLFNISGGTISLAAGTTPAELTIPSLTWPNPTVAQNPATDVASITTTTPGSGQSPGAINFSNGPAINVADPNATLTISADITGIGLSKMGPGTLILSGTQGFNGTLQVAAGTLTIGPSAVLSKITAINVSSGAILNILGSTGSAPVTNAGTINFPALASGIHAVLLHNLPLTTGLKSTVSPAANHSNRTYLTLGALTFTGTTNAWLGQLDLTSNDLDVQSGSLAVITNQIKTGYAGGAWTGQGIISSAAAADGSHLTTLGVILNGTTYSTAAGSLGMFDGTYPAATDVLVKYTYFGDANLDGAVDGSDYTLIDAGFHNKTLTGWMNGDFNYDGVVDGSDYTLIDNAFNTQRASLGSNPLAILAGSTAQVAAVPEPASAGWIAMGTLGLLLRRRRMTTVRVIRS